MVCVQTAEREARSSWTGKVLQVRSVDFSASEPLLATALLSCATSFVLHDGVRKVLSGRAIILGASFNAASSAAEAIRE